MKISRKSCTKYKTAEIDITFTEAHLQVPKSFIDDLRPEEYLIIQTGYHQQFEASKITNFLENFPNRNRTLYIEPPLSGVFKPIRYIHAQSRQKSLAWHEFAGDWIANNRPSWQLFPLTKITDNLFTFDGVHHMFHVYETVWSILLDNFF